MINYEKPKLIFSNVRSNENIANTCWGLTEKHPDQKTRYYDVEGLGFVSFNVKNMSGNCGAPDAYNIEYYEYKDEPAIPGKGAEYEKILEAALTEKGGNNGQPYSGIDMDFPDRPDKMS